MGHLVDDIQSALRTILNRPGLYLLAIFTLGLGMAQVITQATISYASLLRPLGEYEGELIYLNRASSSPVASPTMEIVPDAEFLIWEKEQTTLEGMGAFIIGTINMSDGGMPVRLNGAFVNAGLFDVLGVQPILGRLPLPGEDRPGAEKVLLISYRTWVESFAERPDVIGRQVTINGEKGQVIGVMPKGFNYPTREEAWVPHPFSTEFVEAEKQIGFQVIAKPLPGVKREAIQKEFNAIAATIAQNFSIESPVMDKVRITTFQERRFNELGGVMAVMSGAVLLVLLVACANVANLLLAQATSNARELAVRHAMGATTYRIAQLIICQSLIVSLPALMVGITIASWSLNFNQELIINQSDAPLWFDFSIDGNIVAFCLLLGIFTALLSGIIPAILSSKPALVPLLQDSARTTTSRRVAKVTRNLVIAQVALSTTLLIASGLQMKSIKNALNVDFGYDDSAVLTARLGLFEGDYPDEESRKELLTGLLEELRQQESIQGASLTSALMGRSISWSYLNKVDFPHLSSEDSPENEPAPIIMFDFVDVDYFRTLDIQPSMGRTFIESDFNTTDKDIPDPFIIGARMSDFLFPGMAQPGFGEKTSLHPRPSQLPDQPEPVVVDAKLAQFLWPDQNPLGEIFHLNNAIHFNLTASIKGLGSSTGDAFRVVGVVENQFPTTSPGSSGPQANLGFFRPQKDFSERFYTIVLQTNGNLSDAETALRECLFAKDPNLPPYFVGTPRDHQIRQNGDYQIVASAFISFGITSLFLSAVGLFGLMTFSLNARFRDYSIRLVMGATHRELVVKVFQQGLGQAALGILIGMVAAYWLTQFLQGLLLGVQSFDFPIYTGVALTLFIVGCLACLDPARRVWNLRAIEGLNDAAR